MQAKQPKQPHPNESEFIRRAKAGDRNAFDQLMRMHHTTIFNFAFKVCRNREKAEETLQDTLITVFTKLRQFDGHAKFTTWLYTVIVRHCLLSKRKGKLDRATILVEELQMITGSPDEGGYQEMLADNAASPFDVTVNNELKEKLDAAIGALPYEYRIVFVLSDLEGRTAKEIASIMGLTIPAVKSRLRRARLALRDRLQPILREAS